MKRILIYLLLTTQLMAGMADQVLRNSYSNNSVNITTTDKAGRQALNSIFGDAVVGIRKSYVSKQFVYGIQESKARITQTGTGTISVEDSMLTGQTGTSDGGIAIVETKEYVRYIPGHDTVAYFTAVFSEPKADSYQRMGLYDDEDGYFVGYEGTQFTFTRRKDGVDTNYDIDLSSSKFGLNPEYGNIYRISYGYLGFANITLEVLNPDKGWDVLYNIKYPNKHKTTHIANTYLPMRGEVGNIGNNTNIKLQSGSVNAGIIDGGGMDGNARHQAILLEQIPINIAGDTVTVAIRNKSTYKTKINKIAARLKRISVATDLNKSAVISLYIDPTINNTPTWVDQDAEDSTIQYALDADATIGTGRLLLPVILSKVDKSAVDYTGDNFLLYPGEIAVFFISTTGTGTSTMSISWDELF